MRVVALNKLSEAKTRYPSTESYLRGWLQVINQTNFSSEQDLQITFKALKCSSNVYKFPIPSSNLKVSTLIDFDSQVALITSIKPSMN